MKTIVSAMALSILTTASYAAPVPSELVGKTSKLTYSFDAEVTKVTPSFGLSVSDVVAGLVEVELEYKTSFVDILEFDCSFGGFSCSFGSYEDDSFSVDSYDFLSGKGDYSSFAGFSVSDVSFGDSGGFLSMTEELSGGFSDIRLEFDSFDVAVVGHLPVPASLGFAFLASAAFFGLGVLKRKNGSKSV